jgi:hypothetical protein
MPPRWTALFPFFILHFSLCLSLTAPSGAILYSYLGDLALRPLRENIILQSTHCKQRGATFFFLLREILF